MRKAVLTTIPFFRLYGRSQFATEVRRAARGDGVLGLSVVLADLNGDGIRDAAVLGYDRDSSYFVGIVSKGDTTYDVMHLLAPSDLTPEDTVNRRIYIQKQSRGKTDLYDGADSKGALVLRFDGIVHIVGEEGATLHYWNGTRFVKVDYGD